MAQEIFNQVSKDVVKAIWLNKTQKAIERASKAAGGVQQIVKRLNKVSDVKRVSQRTHSQWCDRR
jgi:acetolactate synthase small subunit